MFSIAVFLRYMLGQVWGVLAIAVLLVIFSQPSVGALFVSATLLAFVMLRAVFMYALAFEKHHQLKERYGAEYLRRLESYLETDGVAGYIDRGRFSLEIELKHPQAKS
ncbi:hypothetical protein U91I_01519 [alpha proteobacterium U9-1i]|nr:hypothetical protein U91I_01519 [alpha proteobacterium U9-1i]